MPTTRSSISIAAQINNTSGATENPITRKRKAKVKTVSPATTTSASKRQRLSAAAKPTPFTSAAGSGEADLTLPATLTFDFDAAKAHLIEQDSRWEDIFKKMKCKPFENLEQVHPFRALTSSILGQQISWMAARSIKHRFIRLFDPSLPENIADFEANCNASTCFPTPHQVFDSNIAALRTAGLSQRKAEYIHDLAARFTDGRLSAKKLMDASDEKLAEMLLEVRGIGQWTVDMFAIFSMRRPNILPVGDLGVQRGTLRWFLSLHSPTYRIMLSQKNSPGDDDEVAKGMSLDVTLQLESLPVATLSTSVEGHKEKLANLSPPRTPITGNLSTIGPGKIIEPSYEPTNDSPESFTPSIDITSQVKANENFNKLPPLPLGLSTGIMKGRLDTRKKIKGALLSEKEMIALTKSWEPYRSIAAYYMWALADEK